jgi:hypothetical protein
MSPDPLEFTPKIVCPPRPAIENAPVLTVGEVTDEVTDKELVLGVVIGDHQRAYPINMLTGPSREIVNDEMGGTAFAATW